MRKLLALLASSCLLHVHAQYSAQEPNIIPIPASVIKQPGSFTLRNNMTISISGGECRSVAEQLASALSVPTGYRFTIGSDAAAAIKLTLLSTPDATLGSEGYRLAITPQGIAIKASRPAGLFYGMQTLLQLLPREIEKKTAVKANWTVPAVSITDQPRFGWRGLMFDVSRHFFTKQEVKQFIDDMVKYKFNLLHLHLTDDQGWRLEIKGLPKLTETGAWRVKRDGKWANTEDPHPDEPKTYGGFYTHDDVKELVQYAKERFVSILPEIDVPGHSMAAIASYPYLTATPGNYWVNASEQFMVWEGAGKFYALKDNNLNPASEKTYEFLDKVFTEVAQLFPFEYIHMGGDECAKNFWEKSDHIKELMKKEQLKDMHEVQSYFVKRVEKIIASKGKKMMGWDEILEGGLAPGAAVMSWRGMKGGIEAAKMNHAVVMSPTDFAYLDYYQGEPSVEPPIYAGLRLHKTYQFDPVPPGIDPKFILGGQGNLWTEQIPNYRAAQYMTWPRGLAIAEALWSPKEKKNWNHFASRVENQFERMDIAGIKFSKAMYDPIISAKKEGDKLMLVVDTEMEGLDVHYSIDETNPDNYYPRYQSPVALPKDVATVKFTTYRNGKQVGRQINLPISELKKRVK